MRDGPAPASMPDPLPEASASDTDLRLAARLASLRQEHGLSLDALAASSGISRATLSRLERAETSPTASLLGRLCTVYGRPMSRLLAEVEADPAQVVRHAEQAVWVDPETGFRRRGVSPPARGFSAELVLGTLPEGATIAYEAPPVGGLEHHLWLLEGRLDLALDGVTHALSPGDCLRYQLAGASRFTCPGPEARYLIAICRP
ncbi:helix-turn-helix domain-containing protein [Methylobacterium terricola]|uniref:Helix-turn-helix domain-containing protein n=2 Tax=Methylobacterium terricola TaxID=2583531 RepID=A0A5C4LJB9_9HYPH|nr:helix-turn-helix domain-containing protein [Methylobacterium terricola]